MKYQVLASRYPDALAAEVESEFEQGWRLVGGVAICSDGQDRDGVGLLIYAQAMEHQ